MANIAFFHILLLHAPADRFAVPLRFSQNFPFLPTAEKSSQLRGVVETTAGAGLLSPRRRTDVDAGGVSVEVFVGVFVGVSVGVKE